MYNISCKIVGISPLLQNRFTASISEGMLKGSRKNTGSTDWSTEWLDKIYQKDGHLYQPANHIEGTLIKAASSFRIKGARGKSWKEPIKAYVYCRPDEIPHRRNGKIVDAPNIGLMDHPTEGLSVSIMRAVIQRNAIARARLQIATGWELEFQLEIIDEQVRQEVVKEILEEAGRAVGIGDYRPRYGRFIVDSFSESSAG